MPVHILEEIQAEAAALPPEKQIEVLDFVRVGHVLSLMKSKARQSLKKMRTTH